MPWGFFLSEFASPAEFLAEIPFHAIFDHPSRIPRFRESPATILCHRLFIYETDKIIERPEFCRAGI